MDWLIFRKMRYKITDFVVQNLKADLYRVQAARHTFRYELDLFERGKRDWQKIGRLKHEDAARLLRLLADADKYLHGRT